ncbi:MAG: hypothetical protein HY331_14565 [Chloroflexi bacterium]|nr:hypothetical protein [Chloroflexota bacterium]
MKLRIATVIGTILVLGLFVVAFTSVASADPPVGRGQGPVVPGRPAAPSKPVAQPVRLAWTTPVLTNTAFLSSGGALRTGTAYTATATFTVTAAITTSQLAFRPVPMRLGRDGQLAVDASSLPARLEPGKTYQVAVRLKTPSVRRAARLNAEIFATQGRHILGRPLRISVFVR